MRSKGTPAPVRQRYPCSFFSRACGSANPPPRHALRVRSRSSRHGALARLDLDGIEILELIASEQELSPDAHYTMFHRRKSSSRRRPGRFSPLRSGIKPTRVVIDSVGELRLLAQSPLRYRRQILALKQFFVRMHSTLLMVDDPRAANEEMAIASIASGIITLERDATPYGAYRRRLQVLKMRGREVREGYHDCRIRKGGLEVYPRLVAAEHTVSYARDSIRAGLRRSISCSAAVWRGVRARCSSARRELVSRHSQPSTRARPPRAASMPRSLSR